MIDSAADPPPKGWYYIRSGKVHRGMKVWDWIEGRWTRPYEDDIGTPVAMWTGGVIERRVK